MDGGGLKSAPGGTISRGDQPLLSRLVPDQGRCTSVHIIISEGVGGIVRQVVLGIRLVGALEPF